jgi:hypothetical protein
VFVSVLLQKNQHFLDVGRQKKILPIKATLGKRARTAAIFCRSSICGCCGGGSRDASRAARARDPGRV